MSGFIEDQRADEEKAHDELQKAHSAEQDKHKDLVAARLERRRKQRRASLVAGAGANPQRKAGGKTGKGGGKAAWRTKERRVAVKMSKAVVAPSVAVFEQQLCTVRADMQALLAKTVGGCGGGGGGTRFEDAQWGPCKGTASIYKKSAADAALKKNPEWKGLVWKHAADFVKADKTSAAVPVLFDGIDPDDIKQGRLGDCYFLSSLSVLAAKAPRIERLFCSSPAAEALGATVVRLNDGKWRPLALDWFFPCAKKSGAPMFSRNKGSAELWVLLLEKAFAKMRGTYWAIGDGGQPGDALFALTGSPSKVFAVKDTQEEKLWHVMDKAHNVQHFLVVASIDPQAKADEKAWKQQGLEPGHAYGVLRALAAKALGGRRVVQIRNPWANEKEWVGEFADKCAIWKNTPGLAEELDHQGDVDDGRFWMSFDDFRSYFSSVTICRYRDNFVFGSADVELTLKAPVAAVRIRVAEGGGNCAGADAGAAVETSLSLVKDAGRATHRVCFDLLLVDANDPTRAERVVSSTYCASRIVSQDCGLQPGRDYVCVVRAVSEDGVSFPKGKGCHVTVSGYSSRALSFEPFGDRAALRLLWRGAIVAAAVADGQPLANFKDGSQLVQWQDEHNSLIAWIGKARTDEVRGRLIYGEDMQNVRLYRHWLENEQAADVDGGEDNVIDVRLRPGESRVLLAAMPSLPKDKKGAKKGATIEFPTIRFTTACSGPVNVPGRSTGALSCAHCGKPIDQGSYRTTDEGENIHGDCFEQYRQKHADKCLLCKIAILSGTVDGKTFSGSSYSISKGDFGAKLDGKVHEECWEAFQRKHAPKCMHCALPTIAGTVDGKTFDGRFYTVEPGMIEVGPSAGKTGKVHVECWNTFQISNAPKCEKCKKAIMPGTSFYTVGGGKVHVGCHE